MNKEVIDNFLNSFLYFYQRLGDDSKIFFERLMREADSVRNGNAQNDFMGIFEEELRKFVEQNDLTNTNAQDTHLNQNDLNNPLFDEQNQNQIKEAQNTVQENKQSFEIQNIPNNIDLPLKNYTLPIKWENFQFNMDLIANKLLEKNSEDLKNMNFYRKEEFLGTPIGVYSRSNLFSEEKIKEFQTQYAKSYLDKLSKDLNMELNFLNFNGNNDVILESRSNLSQSDFLDLVKNRNTKKNTLEFNELNWNFDMQDVRKNYHESKEFLDTFQGELKDLAQSNVQDNNQTLIQAPILDSQLAITPNQEPVKIEKPAYTNLLDFFEKKRLENQNMTISKDEFKKDFLVYCKNNMSEDEMQILVNLYNKEPTKLTREHKDMLEKGMRYNLTNNNLLNKELAISLKNTLGIPLDKTEQAIQKAQTSEVATKTAEIRLVQENKELVAKAQKPTKPQAKPKPKAESESEVKAGRKR